MKHITLDSKKDVKKSVTVFSLQSETNEMGYNSCQVNAHVELDLLIDLSAKVSIIGTFFPHKSLTVLVSHLVCYNNTEIEFLRSLSCQCSTRNNAWRIFRSMFPSRGTSVMGIDLFNKLGFQVTHDGVSNLPQDFRKHFKNSVKLSGIITVVMLTPQ